MKFLICHEPNCDLSPIKPIGNQESINDRNEEDTSAELSCYVSVRELRQVWKTGKTLAKISQIVPTTVSKLNLYDNVNKWIIHAAKNRRKII